MSWLGDVCWAWKGFLLKTSVAASSGDLRYFYILRCWAELVCVCVESKLGKFPERAQMSVSQVVRHKATQSQALSNRCHSVLTPFPYGTGLKSEKYLSLTKNLYCTCQVSGHKCLSAPLVRAQHVGAFLPFSGVLGKAVATLLHRWPCTSLGMGCFLTVLLTHQLGRHVDNPWEHREGE